MKNQSKNNVLASVQVKKAQSYTPIMKNTVSSKLAILSKKVNNSTPGRIPTAKSKMKEKIVESSSNGTSEIGSID